MFQLVISIVQIILLLLSFTIIIRNDEGLPQEGFQEATPQETLQNREKRKATQQEIKEIG